MFRFSIPSFSLIILAGFALFAGSGCSLQKRTLMPGFHVHSAERAHNKSDQKGPDLVKIKYENRQAVYVSIENEGVIEVDEPAPVLMPRVMAIDPIAINTSKNLRRNLVGAKRGTSPGLESVETLVKEKEFDAEKSKKRAYMKGRIRAALAVLTLAQSFFWFGFSGLTLVIAAMFAVSAAKWFALARDEAKLEAWWRQRHSTKGMRRFITWLIAIPVSLGTFLFIALQGL